MCAVLHTVSLHRSTASRQRPLGALPGSALEPPPAYDPAPGAGAAAAAGSAGSAPGRGIGSRTSPRRTALRALSNLSNTSPSTAARGGGHNRVTTRSSSTSSRPARSLPIGSMMERRRCARGSAVARSRSAANIMNATPVVPARCAPARQWMSTEWPSAVAVEIHAKGSLK